MPLTPLHLGPGLALKLVGPRMSLSVFAFAQVAMDVEVIARLLAGAERLHGYTNSIGGATLVVVPAALLGRPLCERLLAAWNRGLAAGWQQRLCTGEAISPAGARSGAVLGVYSHWLLDAVMHADAAALWPFARGNPFLDWLSVDGVNGACAATAALAGLALGVRALVRAR